jgi:hypothetical protein
VKRPSPAQKEGSSRGNEETNAALDAAGSEGWSSLSQGDGTVALPEYTGRLSDGGLLSVMGGGPIIIPGAPIVVKPGAHATFTGARKRERPSTAGSDQAGLFAKEGVGVCPEGARESLFKQEVLGDLGVGLARAGADEAGVIATEEAIGEEMEEWELQVSWVLTCMAEYFQQRAFDRGALLTSSLVRTRPSMSRMR